MARVKPGKNSRVLLVEDSDAVASTLKTLLERRGYDVDIATNVLEGVFMLGAFDYSAVVLDYVFENFTGSDVEDMTVRRKIPTVFYTASDSIKGARSPIVSKMGGPAELLEKVDEISEARR
jgi:DNA-binding response OmpR family regulator